MALFRPAAATMFVAAKAPLHLQTILLKTNVGCKLNSSKLLLFPITAATASKYCVQTRFYRGDTAPFKDVFKSTAVPLNEKVVGGWMLHGDGVTQQMVPKGWYGFVSKRQFVSWNDSDGNAQQSMKKNRLFRDTFRGRADEHITDVMKLSELLKETNKYDPEAVIRFCESQNYDAIKNEAIQRQYTRALALTNRFNYKGASYNAGKGHGTMEYGGTSEWEAQRRGEQRGSDNGMSRGDNRSAFNAEEGLSSQLMSNLNFQLNSKEPIKVVMVEGSKRSIWKLIRSIAFVLIFVSGVSILSENLVQNVQKGITMNSKKVQPVTDEKTTFDDVKGCEEVKDELKEIISYLKDPNKFTRLGARLPKGILLAGPPGTGKTLLARAIAGEAQVPFIKASGSDFEEMFVGVGARRIRDLFSAARKHAPCIVFIDELDAVGSKRSGRDTNSVRMTLNQLLVELDGFDQNEGLVVICATNFLESLDPALLRPGRLDKLVVVPFPDLTGRKEILNLYGEKMVLESDVDLDLVARRTAGMTGADLFNILNIAAVKCAAEGKVAVSMHELEQAFDRVVVGLERRNPMSEEEKKLTAYHESGHTLVSMHTAGTDKLHKATIMPRGNALGVTWFVPEKEKYSQKLYEAQATLDTLMGGKAAEELIYGKENVTMGCASDLKKATNLARSMVTKYGMGMSDSPAPMFIEGTGEDRISESYASKVDACVQTMLNEAYHRAFHIINTHQTELHRLALALVEYETLTSDEIGLVINGKASEVAERRESKQQQKKQKDTGAEK